MNTVCKEEFMEDCLQLTIEARHGIRDEL